MGAWFRHRDTRPEDFEPMTTRSYEVSGMSCANCVSHVTKAVSAIPGIESVDVILDTGRLTVKADTIDDAAIATAVDEAGYSLAT